MTENEAPKKPPPSPCEAVFENDLLRELIMHLVIHDGSTKTKICEENAKSCRQVNKLWFDTVNKYLARIGKSLYNLTFNYPTHFPASIYSKAQEDICRIFNISTFPLNPISLTTRFMEGYKFIFQGVERATPFVLNVRFNVEKSQREQLTAFLHFLQFCGSGVVHMSLVFVLDKEYLTTDDPLVRLEVDQPLYLPALQTLTLYFPEDAGGDADMERDQTYYERFTVPVINAILSGSERLSSIIFSDGVESLPNDFKHIALPPTITKVTINQELCQDHVDALGNNVNRNLKLTHLVISAPARAQNGNDLLLPLLETYKNTLKIISVGCGTRSSSKITRMELPVMQSLQEFYFCVGNCPLENRQLERQLPELNKLVLTPTTGDVVRSWTIGSRLLSVKELTVDFFTPDLANNFLTLELSRGISKAFPNITNLTLATYIGEPDQRETLQKLLASVTQLQVLNLNLSARCGPVDIHILNSVFLKATPWTDGELEGAFNANLLVLKELTIQFRSCTGSDIGGCIWISDLMIERALLKLPKLQKLTIGKAVKISKRTMERWTQEGRKVYSISTRMLSHPGCHMERCLSSSTCDEFYDESDDDLYDL